LLVSSFYNKEKVEEMEELKKLNRRKVEEEDRKKGRKRKMFETFKLE